LTSAAFLATCLPQIVIDRHTEVDADLLEPLSVPVRLAYLALSAKIGAHPLRDV
jgi:hypothetical protein